MKNFNNVCETANLGGLWHAQQVLGTVTAGMPTGSVHLGREGVTSGVANNGMRFAPTLGASKATTALPAMAVIAVKAPAQRAPQSRGSSAHT